MAIYACKISGEAQQTQVINPEHITKGTRSPYVQHSYQNLMECPCVALDRFEEHGRLIREAYENAVVNAIQSFFPSRDSALINKGVNIVVVGSGGLLQEAFWLSKLYRSRVQPSELTLHFVDTDYKELDTRIQNFVTYALKNIVPKNVTLNVYGWNSWESLKQKVTKPDLVIGIDTEGATPDGTRYQAVLKAGDLEKVLIVRWEPSYISTI